MNWIQRITLILFVTVVVNWITVSLTGYSLLGADLFTIFFIAFLFLATVTLIRPLMRRILWRVRNRLFVTYFLIGVVPILLLVMIATLLYYAFAGATVAYLAQSELNRRLDQLLLDARNLAEDLETGRRRPVASEFPVQAIARVRSRTVASEGLIRAVPAWSQPGFKGMLRANTRTYFLAAHAQSAVADRSVEVFAYRSFDEKALASLAPGFGRILLLYVMPPPIEGTDSDPVIALDSPGSENSDTIEFGGLGGFQLVVRALDGGNSEGHVVSVIARPALVVDRMLSTLGTWRSAAIVGLLSIIAVFMTVDLIAIVSSIKLTRTLTRTIHDLYMGTKKVEAGDFSHRIPVRTKDQLSELAGSFNAMTQQVERLIVQVKEKEKLEAELEIARQVQSQLFPKQVPKLQTLELAGVCNPARIVSGDYYDFIPLDSRSTALVIGDIAGKGISAALLMASLQSSLHAQLTMNTNSGLSTATLVARLNRQLYESTPPEKYATFYCGLYDDLNGLLAYTNAGHLAPILIRDSGVIRLESNGMVVGMFPDFAYEQNVMQLQPGDLLTAFTDGITECENARGEQFGEQRLAGLLLRNRDRSLDEILRSITDTVRGWSGGIENQDDTTILLARRL